MPIRILGSQYIRTTTETAPGGASIGSFQCWLKLGTTSGNNSVAFGKSGNTPFVFGDRDSPSGGATRNFFARWVTSAYTIGAAFNLKPDVVYHLVSTFDAGVVRGYVNGALIYSSTQAASPLVSVSHPWQVGTTGTGGDLTIDDVCYWNGYALTQQDILDLRNRTRAPGEIAAPSILLNWPLDGTPGTTVQLDDASVKTAQGGGQNASMISGTPTYTADVFTYTPPIRVKSAYVGPSRKTLVFIFETLNGGKVTAANPASHPTVSLEGGDTVSLASPGALSHQDHLIYPLPFTIPEGAQLTYTANEGWMVTSAGAIAGSVAVPVTTMPVPITVPVLAEPKTMKLGFNIESGGDTRHLPVYVNRLHDLRHGFTSTADTTGLTLDADDNITALAMGEASLDVWYPMSSGNANPDIGLDKGYFTLGDVDLVLEWDGTAMLQLVGNVARSTITLLETVVTGSGEDRHVRRVYRHRVRSGVYNAFITLLFGPGSSRNVRLVDSTVPIGHTSRFHPEFLVKLAGSRVIRVMDATNTNGSNVSTFDQFTPRSHRSYGFHNAQLLASITSIGTYSTSPLNYFPNRTPFVVTTSAPHGFKDGEVIRFSNLSGTITCANGATPSIEGLRSTIRVLSPTTFAACVFLSPNTTVLNGQTRTGTLRREIYNAMPIDDCIDLCNEIGADAWLSVPHLLDDAGVQEMARLYAERLAPGSKCHCEYSNECWNFALGFFQTGYCDSMGVLDGIGGRQWYVKRSAQVHAIFAAEFAAAGRPDDLVRTLAGQAANPDLTSQLLDYALSIGMPIDEFAIAPYFQTFAPGPEAVYAALDVDQLMDVSDMCLLSFPADLVRQHRALLIARYPEAKLVSYEGGMEVGLPAHLAYLAGNPAGGAMSRAWSRHPRMRGQLLRYLQNMQDGGCDLFAYFILAHPPHNYNSLIKGAVWGVYGFSRSTLPGAGDGSDGQFDNRTNYEALDRVVSVIGQGMRDWMSLTAKTAQNVGIGRTRRVTPGQKPTRPVRSRR